MISKVTEVSLERAYEMAEKLTGKLVHENNSLTIVSGTTVEGDDLYIIIPAFGSSLLLPARLPIATQSASS